MSRREIDVWPAVADLMSTIAVLGLVFAAVMSHQLSIFLKDPHAMERILEENEALKKAKAGLEKQNEDLAAEIRELSTMQHAVGVADDAMKEVADALHIQRQADLSIVFGENIVSFSTNEVEPKLSEEGRREIKRFCNALRDALARLDPSTGVARANFAILQVEGHTDSTHCLAEPECNWRYSAERAARFRAMIADASLCPGSAGWTIRPVGLADSKPRATPAESRRIELRLVPDYAAILKRVGQAE